METTHEGYGWSEREAHRRAAWRLRWADELLRYVLLSTLLVILIRPIGVIVALVWGLGLVHRYYHREMQPRLRRRWVRQELHRHGAGRRAGDPARRPGGGPERLVRDMGDDPRRTGALDWARTALDELAAQDGRCGSREQDGEARVPGCVAQASGRGARPVRMADVVEDVVDAFETRAAREGVELELEVDAEGEVHGDPRRLRAVVLELVGDSLRALARGARGPARVRIEMGENLAGSEVWVRIRDHRSEAGEGARGTYGSRPVEGIPGATLETQSSPRNGVERILTLPKASAPRGEAAAR